MDMYIETTKRVGATHFVSIDLSDPAIPYAISSQGFLDKAKNIYDLTYYDVNANEKGKGIGRKGLVKLNEIFAEIHVYGTEPQALEFWVKMYKEKLVTSIHWDFKHLSARQLKVFNLLMH